MSLLNHFHGEWTIRPWWEWIRFWILLILMTSHGYHLTYDVTASIQCVPQHREIELSVTETRYLNRACASRVPLLLRNFPLWNMVLIMLTVVIDTAFWRLIPKVRRTINTLLSQDKIVREFGFKAAEIEDIVNEIILENDQSTYDSDKQSKVTHIGEILRNLQSNPTKGTSQVMMYVVRNTISHMMIMASLWILQSIQTSVKISCQMERCRGFRLDCSFQHGSIEDFFISISVAMHWVFAVINLLSMIFVSSASLQCEEKVSKFGQFALLYVPVNILSVPYMFYAFRWTPIQHIIASRVICWCCGIVPLIVDIESTRRDVGKYTSSVFCVLYVYFEYSVFLARIQQYESSDVATLIFKLSLPVGLYFALVCYGLKFCGSIDCESRRKEKCFHENGHDGRFIFTLIQLRDGQIHPATESVLFPCKTGLTIQDILDFLGPTPPTKVDFYAVVRFFSTAANCLLMFIVTFLLLSKYI